MQADITEAQTCLVYRGNGNEPQRFSSPGFEPAVRTRRPSASAVPLRQIMSRQLICARPDLDVEVVIRLMMQHHIGCMPVIDDRQHPIGMITKTDLIEQRTGSSADEVMMPLAFCLSEYATIAHAASMMVAEDTHHVIVIGHDDRIVGVVSSRDIVGWLLDTDGP